MKLTVQTLIEAKACVEQVGLFKKLFPYGAEISEEVAISVAIKFDWEWAANNLLSESGRVAYREAQAPLWKAYEEAQAPLWKTYSEAQAPLWKAYREAEASLWKTYSEAQAQIFAKLYLKENS